MISKRQDVLGLTAGFREAAGVTQTLAAFAAETEWSSLPSSLRERVKDVLLDSIACAIAGQSAIETPAFVAMASAMAGSGTSTVVAGRPLSLAGATMVNGFLITAQMMCDVHWPTLCHVTPEVLPPTLAIAERVDSSGIDVLLAFAVGLEVCTRVGLGLDYQTFRARGWHAPGITGPFGGAAAAGRLLGLSGDRMAVAMSLAGSQAAGTFAQLGTPALKFQQARGALSGVIAALLANEGLEATREILTHPDGGLYRGFSGDGNPKAALEGLGVTWELEQLSMRLWPVGVHLQGVVSGLLAILREESLSVANVKRIDLAVGAAAYRTHAPRSWAHTFAARMSAHWTAAVVLQDHACWIEQFTQERLADKEVDRFAATKVTLVQDESLSPGAAEILIETIDGRILHRREEMPPGVPNRPLCRSQIVEKLTTAAADPAWAQAIVHEVTETEMSAGSREFVRLLSAVQPQRHGRMGA